MTIINLSKQNISRATETLFLAFRNDPLMLWMFDGEDNYQQKATWAIHTWVRWCELYGVAIATPQCESVALIKKPNKHDFNFWSVLRSGMWQFSSKLGKATFDRVMLLDDLLQKEQLRIMGSNNFWYCWLVGTNPASLQCGYAKQLMHHTSTLANDMHLPCYLETAGEQSLKFHQKMGYLRVSTLEIPGSQVTIHCMVKQPE